MLRKIFISVKLICITFIFIFNLACGDGYPENILPVPYKAQQGINWCANACVQMWAHYDGYTNVTQWDIAAFMGNLDDTRVSPYKVENAVYNFTNSPAYLATKDIFTPGAQGDLISASINGIKENLPSIMPYMATHAVIVNGYKWDDVNPEKPIAIDIIYHCPKNGANIRDTANVLKTWFQPSNWDYFVILAYQWLLDEGIWGHDDFVRRGGVYYGGPPVYNPKGLQTNPPPPPPASRANKL